MQVLALVTVGLRTTTKQLFNGYGASRLTKMQYIVGGDVAMAKVAAYVDEVLFYLECVRQFSGLRECYQRKIRVDLRARINSVICEAAIALAVIQLVAKDIDAPDLILKASSFDHFELT